MRKIINIKLRTIFQFIIISSILFVMAGLGIYRSSVNKSLQEEERSLKTGFLLKEKFSPFEQPGKKPAVLLIHGFGGSPHDVKPLTQELVKNNIAVYSILLSGHGTSPKDLLTVNDGDWFKEVLNAYDYLHEKYGKVNVVGFSVGGALALKLAVERPVEKLALISPYFKIKRPYYCFGSLEWWARKINKVLPFVRKFKIGQINNSSGLSKYVAYKHLPLKSIKILKRLGDKSFASALLLKSPVLVLHSEGDTVADFDKSYQAFQQMSSMDKKFIKYKRSNHVILYDYDAKDVLEQVMNFLQKKT
jgi:carboxylesterase